MVFNKMLLGLGFIKKGSSLLLPYVKSNDINTTMARPLRIEYPGAWYHIMKRGRRSEKIFLDENDYRLFLLLLEETSEIWNVRVAAYCLMPNHYHLLIQTPDANISSAMRQINGIYTQRFNRKHAYDGPLFRGRYKSNIVSEDEYLLALVRYIHKNPLEVGIVDNLKEYVWSSHQGYLSSAKKWEWLYKGFIFSLLSPNNKQWRKLYMQLMESEEDQEVESVLESKKWPPVIGPKKFNDKIKIQFYALKINDEVPEAKKLAPGVDVILKAVAAHYDVSQADILKTHRGILNEPRNVTVYLIRVLRHDSLKQIGEIFNTEEYSSISSIIERVKKQISRDPKFKKKIDKLSLRINNGREQT